jgi:hypothetical protein
MDRVGPRVIIGRLVFLGSPFFFQNLTDHGNRVDHFPPVFLSQLFSHRLLARAALTQYSNIVLLGHLDRGLQIQTGVLHKQLLGLLAHKHEHASRVSTGKLCLTNHQLLLIQLDYIHLLETGPLPGDFFLDALGEQVLEVIVGAGFQLDRQGVGLVEEEGFHTGHQLFRGESDASGHLDVFLVGQSAHVEL